MTKTLLVCLCAVFSLFVLVFVPAPAQASVQLSSSSLSFGSVNVGSSSAAQTIVITNGNRRSITVNSISSSSPDFVVSSISLPDTLAEHATASFTVSFDPAAAAAYSGTITVSFQNHEGSTVKVALTVSGTGVSAPAKVPEISVAPSSAGFGSVTTGVTDTQTLVISNPGTANLVISGVTISGAGFNYSGITVPLTIAPSAKSSLTVSFDPSTAGSASGSLVLTNNSATSSLAIPLSGTGVAPVLQLSASPSSLSFGDVNTGSSATGTVTLSNTGNANVSISKDAITGTGFSLTGLSLPVTIDPNQSTSFSVVFAPTSSGSVSGNVSITSSATNSPISISITGTGTSATYSVLLSWTPSSSSFAGFNIYRSTVSGGPYTKLDSSLITAESYTDTNVTNGGTYYYVATQVNSSGAESEYSSQVAATIP